MRTVRSKYDRMVDAPAYSDIYGPIAAYFYRSCMKHLSHEGKTWTSIYTYTHTRTLHANVTTGAAATIRVVSDRANRTFKFRKRVMMKSPVRVCVFEFLLSVAHRSAFVVHTISGDFTRTSQACEAIRDSFQSFVSWKTQPRERGCYQGSGC